MLTTTVLTQGRAVRTVSYRFGCADSGCHGCVDHVMVELTKDVLTGCADKVLSMLWLLPLQQYVAGTRRGALLGPCRESAGLMCDERERRTATNGQAKGCRQERAKKEFFFFLHGCAG